MSERLTVVVVRTMDEMREALSVRRAVFIEEQGVPEAHEIDAGDADPATVPNVVHVLARLGERPVGTGRLLIDMPFGASAHVGRVAVLAQRRRAGVGRAVMEALHREARRLEFPGITLAAQVQAMPFYESLGYAARGEPFIDEGIEHRWMDLRFTPASR